MGNRPSVFEMERNNLGSRASYMPRGRVAPQTEAAETKPASAVLNNNKETAVTPDVPAGQTTDTSSDFASSNDNVPAAVTETEETAAIQTDSVEIMKSAVMPEEKESSEEDKKPAEPKQKKKKSSENSAYKRRSSTLAGNEELKETMAVSLKLTPYTKALLEMISKVSGHSCQAELADVAIHNYLVKEYAQFLPLVDMYYANIDPDADVKLLHKKK